MGHSKETAGKRGRASAEPWKRALDKPPDGRGPAGSRGERPGDGAFDQPGTLRLFAPAKVNLFLGVGERRTDGMHEVVTIMHAIDVGDVVSMRLAPGQGAGLTVGLETRSCEGLAPLGLAPEDNIATRAVRLLAEAVGRDRDETLLMCIEKHIPVQAGLGGGSSDAAAALLGAARLWGIDPGDPRIEALARSLGADVAFFLQGGCACFTGAGESFERRLEAMEGAVAVVKPGGGVSTDAAYRAFDARPQPVDHALLDAALRARRAEDVILYNNLGAASERLLPEIAVLRAWACACDHARDALMSGSGSAVFMRCDSDRDVASVVEAARARGWWARRSRFKVDGVGVALLEG